jgi:hypothetical protein
MKPRPSSMIDFVKALAGPIVWAGHFFFLYLTEAFAGAGGSPAAAVRWSGIGATLVALAALALFSMRSSVVYGRGNSALAEPAFPFAKPLIFLSMIAVVWSSLPLFLLSPWTQGMV